MPVSSISRSTPDTDPEGRAMSVTMSAHEVETTARGVLESLSAAECRELLRPGGAGRIVFFEARGPAALPVEYQMLGDDVIFRTTERSGLRTLARGGRVSFEVDHLDDEGWIVLLRGYAREVDGPHLDAAWPDASRPVYLRLEMDHVSGRRCATPPAA
jgi:hypothetical protein